MQVKLGSGTLLQILNLAQLLYMLSHQGKEERESFHWERSLPRRERQLLQERCLSTVGVLLLEAIHFCNILVVYIVGTIETFNEISSSSVELADTSCEEISLNGGFSGMNCSMLLCTVKDMQNYKAMHFSISIYLLCISPKHDSPYMYVSVPEISVAREIYNYVYYA